MTLLPIVSRMARLARRPPGSSLVPRPRFMMLLGLACAILLADGPGDWSGSLLGQVDLDPPVLGAP